MTVDVVIQSQMYSIRVVGEGQMHHLLEAEVRFLTQYEST